MLTDAKIEQILNKEIKRRFSEEAKCRVIRIVRGYIAGAFAIVRVEYPEGDTQSPQMALGATTDTGKGKEIDLYSHIVGEDRVFFYADAEDLLQALSVQVTWKERLFEPPTVAAAIAFVLVIGITAMSCLSIKVPEVMTSGLALVFGFYFGRSSDGARNASGSG